MDHYIGVGPRKLGNREIVADYAWEDPEAFTGGCT